MNEFFPQEEWEIGEKFIPVDGINKTADQRDHEWLEGYRDAIKYGNNTSVLEARYDRGWRYQAGFSKGLSDRKTSWDSSSRLVEQEYQRVLRSDDPDDRWLRQKMRSEMRYSAGRSGLFWRVHDKSRPFTIEQAYSVGNNPWSQSDDFLRSSFYRLGFSAIDDPWSLWAYVMAYGWYWSGLVQDDYVIQFSGRQTTKADMRKVFEEDEFSGGFSEQEIQYRLSYLSDPVTGPDGEFCVIPDFSTVSKMSWNDFEDLLIRTPLPSRPSGHGNAKIMPTWDAYIGELWSHSQKRGLKPGRVLEHAHRLVFGKSSSINDPIMATALLPSVKDLNKSW